MEKRRFGRTGLQVSVLGFGAAQMGYEQASPETVDRLLGITLDSGINVIDTAESYGESEAMIGRAIAHRRSEYNLFTKCGHTSWDPDFLRRSIDQSLKRLRTDYVDLINLHSPSIEVLGQGDVVEVLQDAKAAGKTRWIGCSADGVEAAYVVDCGLFDVIQTSLNVADQEAIDLTLPKATEADMGVIVKRPIANAVWLRSDRNEISPYSQPYWDRLQELNYEFLRTGGTAEHLRRMLQFTFNQKGVHVTLVGTKNPDELLADIAAAVEVSPSPLEETQAIRDRWLEVASPSWTGRG